MSRSLRVMTPADLEAVLGLELASFGEEAWSRRMLGGRAGRAAAQPLLPDRRRRRGDHRLRRAARWPAGPGRRAHAGGRRRPVGPGTGAALLEALLAEAGPARLHRGVPRGAHGQRPGPAPVPAATDSFRSGSGRGYYQPSGADALVMRRDLGGARVTTRSCSASRPRATRPGSGMVRGHDLLADAVARSVDEHARFGGVVPEVASRAHLEAMVPTVRPGPGRGRGRSWPTSTRSRSPPAPAWPARCWSGSRAAKAYALALGKPMYGVNHLAAHVAVDQLEHGPLPQPAMALLVSGGHSSLLLVPDLAGERDAARGHHRRRGGRGLRQGGPAARPAVPGRAADRPGGRATATRPRSPSRAAVTGPPTFDFSFSGLKTAVARWVEARRARPGEPVPVADVAASFQEAVADVLTRKAVRACREHGVDHLLIGGGVAANSRLRALAERALRGGRASGCGCRGPGCAPTTARWWRRSAPELRGPRARRRRRCRSRPTRRCRLDHASWWPGPAPRLPGRLTGSLGDGIMFGVGTREGRVPMRRGGLAPATAGRRSPSTNIQRALSGGGGQIVTTATKVDQAARGPYRRAGRSRPSRPPPRASSSRTPPRRSPRRARSWRSARAASTTTGKRVPLDVTVGDVVLYSKYGGTEVKYAGEEYLVLSARDVLAVIEK